MKKVSMDYLHKQYCENNPDWVKDCIPAHVRTAELHEHFEKNPGEFLPWYERLCACDQFKFEGYNTLEQRQHFDPRADLFVEQKLF